MAATLAFLVSLNLRVVEADPPSPVVVGREEVVPRLWLTGAAVEPGAVEGGETGSYVRWAKDAEEGPL